MEALLIGLNGCSLHSVAYPPPRTIRLRRPQRWLITRAVTADPLPAFGVVVDSYRLTSVAFSRPLVYEQESPRG